MMTSFDKPASPQPVLPKPQGRFSKTASYFASFVILGLSVACIGPTLPGLAQHTRTTLGQISLLFTANFLGYLLGSLLGGRLYDRISGHPVMALALMVMALMMVLAPVMSLLWLLMAVLLGLGFAQGTLDVGGNTLLVWIHREAVGPSMNGLHFCFGLGAFLSPIIIARVVLMSGDITWAYWILASIMLPLAIWLWFLSSPRVEKTSREGTGNRSNLKLVALIALFFFLFVGGEISFGGWIFTYALTLELAAKTTAAYLTSAFWGSLTIGRLLAIPLAFRFQPRTILLADLIGALCSGGIILVWSQSKAAVWLGAVGMGLSMAPLFPITLAFAERRMTISGRVTGWFIFGGSLGSMFLPWLIGQIFESMGPRWMVILFMVDLGLALVVLSVLSTYPPRTVKEAVGMSS